MNKTGEYGQNRTLNTKVGQHEQGQKKNLTYRYIDKIVKSWKIWTNRQKPENTYVEARDDARVKKK